MICKLKNMFVNWKVVLYPKLAVCWFSPNSPLSLFTAAQLPFFLHGMFSWPTPLCTAHPDPFFSIICVAHLAHQCQQVPDLPTRYDNPVGQQNATRAPSFIHRCVVSASNRLLNWNWTKVSPFWINHQSPIKGIKTRWIWIEDSLRLTSSSSPIKTQPRRPLSSTKT
jgi:hypothetical protein